MLAQMARTVVLVIKKNGLLYLQAGYGVIKLRLLVSRFPSYDCQANHNAQRYSCSCHIASGRGRRTCQTGVCLSLLVVIVRDIGLTIIENLSCIAKQVDIDSKSSGTSIQVPSSPSRFVGSLGVAAKKRTFRLLSRPVALPIRYSRPSGSRQSNNSRVLDQIWRWLR